MKFNRKKTATLTLVLIASVTLKACEPRRSREVYRNYEDCKRDWNESLCTPVTDSSYSSGHYYGPYYRSSGGRLYYYRTYRSDPAPVPRDAGIVKSPSGRSIRSVGRVSRGGFGSSVRGGSRGG